MKQIIVANTQIKLFTSLDGLKRKDMAKGLDYILNDLVRQKQKIIDDFLKEQLKRVEPPIKGEITKGKLKWRGVRLGVQDTTTIKKRYFLIQRGVEIGDSIYE